jgi:serine/alanine adding enzyme
MFRLLRTLDEDCWRQFLEHNPAATIFHTPEMFAVFSRAKGYQPQLWAVAAGQNQILALLLPVEVSTLSRNILPRLTARAIAYGGVVFEPSPLGEEALDYLLRSYTRQAGGATLFTELRHLYDMEKVQPLLQQRGFTYEPHLNYLVNLARPVEEILQSVGPRTRKRLRKALREGTVQIEEITDRSQLRQGWYDVLAKTYQTAQVPLADISLFEAAFDELHPKGLLKLLVARVENAVAACSAELLYKDTIYGWYGGSDRDYGKYNANEILTWHILDWGATHGYRLYDFGGAGKPDEEYGVRDFKAKFGGDLVCYGRNSYIYSQFRLRLSTAGYKAYQRLAAPKLAFQETHHDE